MSATEILNEIYRLPLSERKKVKQTLLEESDAINQTVPKVTQDEFDQMLFNDGLLVNFPIEVDDEEKAVDLFFALLEEFKLEKEI